MRWLSRWLRRAPRLVVVTRDPDEYRDLCNRLLFFPVGLMTLGPGKIAEPAWVSASILIRYEPPTGDALVAALAERSVR